MKSTIFHKNKLRKPQSSGFLIKTTSIKSLSSEKTSKVPLLNYQKSSISSILSEKLSKTKNPLVFHKNSKKKETISPILSEIRFQSMANSPLYKEKPQLPDGFFQESLTEAFDGKNKKTIIKLIPDLTPENKIILKQSSLDEVTNKKLTQQSVSFIISEYQKPKDSRNYEELIKKFGKLPFFQKFPKTIQKMLLEIALLQTYKVGETIIKQGDLGECMFVILSGSVNICRQGLEYRNMNIIVNSLYDGEAFGELALLSNPVEESIRRTASCVAAETTTVISISKEDYRSILIDKMQSDIIERISFIKNLKFFVEEN